MKKYICFLPLLCLAACHQNGNDTLPQKDTTMVSGTTDTIPETRPSIQPEAVSSYSEKVDDELNNWKFAVSLYETKKTFQYLVRIEYKELRVTDSIQVPDLGFFPKVAVHKGKEPLSCILGFFDKKGEYKEYRLVRVKDDRLKITTLNTYYVGHYRTKIAEKE